MKKEELRQLPKVELHCHLDGSLTRGLIERRLGRQVSQEELMVSDDCTSLAEYLEKFDLPGRCLMDEQGLAETEDMNCSKVIEALLSGLERGKKEFGVEYGVLTCAMRHHSEEENYRMLRAAREYLGSGVCGADLAGAEAAYPMSEFMELFTKVGKLGIPFTLHAGECGNPQNIIDSVQVGAKRIGHGIAMRGHKGLQRELAARNIGIEMCPISNLQTKAVNITAEYPLREFLDAGLKVSINTDNRTVSNTTLTKELDFIQRTYGIQDEEILLLMKNAADTAFASDEVKAELYRKLGIK